MEDEVSKKTTGEQLAPRDYQAPLQNSAPSGQPEGIQPVFDNGYALSCMPRSALLGEMRGFGVGGQGNAKGHGQLRLLQ